MNEAAAPTSGAVVENDRSSNYTTIICLYSMETDNCTLHLYLVQDRMKLWCMFCGAMCVCVYVCEVESV